MTPGSAHSDVARRLLGHAVFAGYGAHIVSGRISRANGPDLVGTKARPPRAMDCLVGLILGECSPREVVQVAIRGVAVNVTDALCPARLGRSPNHHEKTMHIEHFHTPARPEVKVHLGIVADVDMGQAAEGKVRRATITDRSPHRAVAANSVTRETGNIAQLGHSFLCRVRLALAIPVVGIISGCAAQPSVPVSDLRPWQPITYSCKDTAGTRAQIIAHDSVYDSLKTGRKVVIQDKCTEAKP